MTEHSYVATQKPRQSNWLLLVTLAILVALSLVSISQTTIGLDGQQAVSLIQEYEDFFSTSEVVDYNLDDLQARE